MESFAAVGYCFGGEQYSSLNGIATEFHIGRYVFDLAFEHIISAAAVAHPSMLKVPEDLEVRANCLYVSTRL